MFEYKANIIRWIDGDTLDLSFDLGFGIYFKQRCRLNFVDTPERGKPNYAEAKAFCEAKAPAGSVVVVQTYKGDKYGRYLVRIPVGDSTISTLLIEAKLGVAYFGGTKWTQTI